MPASEADQRGDADSTKLVSVLRKSKSEPPKRARSPLPWFLRPNPPNKHSGFIYKGGIRTHPHPPLDVPYPLTYGNHTMELEALADYTRRVFSTTDISSLDAQGVQPKRTLDLGCGNGYWITRAVRKWRNTEFVGFDISPVQVPLDELDDDACGRITWVHGNFLNPWPFENSSFDHIRIRAIGYCVPELKWPFVISEMRRVLTVGGRYEWYEEDIKFPHLLPENPLEDGRSSPPRSTTPDSFSSSSSSTSSFRFNPGSYPPGVLEYDPQAGYDDDVIEALYYRLFQDRQINLQPTTQIPLYLNTYFNGNLIADRARLPMPQCLYAWTAPPPTWTDGESSTRSGVSSSTRSDRRPPTYAIRFVYPNKMTESKGRMVTIDDLKVHHKIAAENVMAAREAVWDWIVETQNWSEIAFARDPVVAEARRDLEYAFRVFGSRLEHSSDFNRHQARFDFFDDDIRSAYEGLDDETETDVQSLSMSGSRNGIVEARAPQSPRLHPQEAPWMSLRDSDELARRLSSDSGHPNSRHSRTSSEVPASNRSSSSASAAASRSRTSSAPESLQNSRNGVVAYDPANIYDAGGNFVCVEDPSTGLKCRQDLILINSPEAEQTVPYASRIVRFFSGIKGPED